MIPVGAGHAGADREPLRRLGVVCWKRRRRKSIRSARISAACGDGYRRGARAFPGMHLSWSCDAYGCLHLGVQKQLGPLRAVGGMSAGLCHSSEKVQTMCLYVHHGHPCSSTLSHYLVGSHLGTTPRRKRRQPSHCAFCSVHVCLCCWIAANYPIQCACTSSHGIGFLVQPGLKRSGRRPS